MGVRSHSFSCAQRASRRRFVALASAGWHDHLAAVRFAAAIVGLIVAAQPIGASATLIATDHFNTGNPAVAANGEYSVTQLRRSQVNGAGQDPTIAGFTGAWEGNVTSGSLAVAQWTAESDGISSGLPFSQGGRARFAGVDNLQRRVQRALAPYASSNAYYMSVASQVLTDDANWDGFVGVGFTNTGATAASTDANIAGGNGLRGLLIGAAGNGSGTDYVVRHVGSTGVVQNDVILGNIVQNTPEGSPFIRYTIVKLEFNDDPDNPAGNSKLTIWQDPTDVSSEFAATASTPPLELRTFSLSASTDLTHLTLTGLDYSRASSFDEPRLATSWNGVTGVPEPTSCGLAGMAVVAVAASRRRR